MTIHTFEPPTEEHSWAEVSVEYPRDRSYCSVTIRGFNDGDPAQIELGDAASVQSLLFALNCVLHMHDNGELQGYSDQQPE